MNYRFLKIFFAFVSPYDLVGIGTCLLLRRTTQDYLYLFTNVILILAACQIFARLGYFVREVGRLTLAKIAGGSPHHIVIGEGAKLTEFELLRVKVAIYEKISASSSWAFFGDTAYLKLRYGVYLSGKVATNALLALLAYLLFGIHPELLLESQGIDLPMAFILANLFLILLEFYPVHHDYREVGFASNSLTLFTLHNAPKKALVTNANQIFLMDANDYTGQKKYDKTIPLYKGLLTKKMRQSGLSPGLSWHLCI